MIVMRLQTRELELLSDRDTVPRTRISPGKILMAWRSAYNDIDIFSTKIANEKIVGMTPYYLLQLP